MADHLKIQFDAARLTAALRQYGAVSRRDTATILEQQGKKLTHDLYRAYKPFVPTKQRIRDEALDVFARGGRLRTKFKTAGGVTFSRHAGPRSAGSARFNIPAAIMAEEIAWRQSHRFVTAASWLYKRWRPSKSAPGGRRLVGNGYRDCVALIATDGDRPYVELRNSRDGVLQQDRRHGLMGKALAQRAGDMLMHVKKQHERRAAAFSRANPVFSS